MLSGGSQQPCIVFMVKYWSLPWILLMRMHALEMCIVNTSNVPCNIRDIYGVCCERLVNNFGKCNNYGILYIVHIFV